ncbi:MAG: type II secretion system F family protein, partial [Betaproteobacteria bacterium]|nr:type II secretion system F family protein [Betaproteobacteria bacterium]
PHFAYKARDSRGQMVQGVLEGADSGAVAGQLFNTGVTPLEISPSAAPRQSGTDLLARLTERKIEHTEVLLFSRQMYTLLKAGVPIMGALKGLEESSENKSLSRVIREIRESLDSGHELSVCLSRHPKVFNPFFVAMVRVGELTGTLEEVFLRMFHHLEFEKFMREQVKSAVRYPSFVVATMAVAIVIINIFVIPAFAKVYAGFKAELPAMTKALIAFSNFTVSYWWAMLIALAAAVVAFRFYVGTEQGRLVWDRYKFRIPVAGGIILKATLARFARSLSLAIRSGVPAVQALTMVARTVDNVYMARKIEAMREGVERGESVLRTATATGVFTPIVLQMVAVGEETGALDDLMAEIADMYQREVEYDLKNLASQIEPILVVALGVLVLILALGVFLPIWDLGNAALSKK